MALESNTNNTIQNLDTNSPTNFDLINEGDDHIRMIKRVLKNIFPKIDKPLAATSDGINKLGANITADDTSITISGAVNAAAGKLWDLKGAVLNNIATSKDTAKTSKNVVNIEYLYNHAADAAYPKGSLFFTTSTVAPATQLGLAGSTWSAFGGGRIIIGVGSDSDPAGQSISIANGQKGGYYKVGLSADEGPRHGHSLSNVPVEVDGVGNHNHRMAGDDGMAAWNHKVQGINYDAKSHGGDGGIFETTDAGAHTHAARIRAANTTMSGNGVPHENTQPYIGVFIWKRES